MSFCCCCHNRHGYQLFKDNYWITPILPEFVPVFPFCTRGGDILSAISCRRFSGSVRKISNLTRGYQVFCEPSISCWFLIDFVLHIHSVTIILFFKIYSTNKSIYVDNNCLNCIIQEICVPDLFLGLFARERGGDMLSAISCRISKGSVKKNVYIYMTTSNWRRDVNECTTKQDRFYQYFMS